MSKKQNSNGTGPIEDEDYVITSTGARVELVLVPPMLLQKTQTQGTLPTVPFRELETAFGETQKEPLSEEDLQTAEEKAQWAEYIEKRDAVLEKRNTDFIKAILIKGTRFDDSTIEAWKKEQVEEWGFELPEKTLDLKMEYIQMEIAPTQEDQMKIVLGVLGKSGVPEKEMESVRSMFRSALRGNTAGAIEDGAGGVGVGGGV